VASPFVNLPDPIEATLLVLTGLALPGVTYGSVSPDKLTPTPPAPYVAVGVNGNDLRYPVVEFVTLRLSVWGTDARSGQQLARDLRAHLLSYPGGVDVARFGKPVFGPIPTEDPDDGSPLSYFTVTACLRPSPTLQGETQ
jgi:hypothetical protein